MIFIDSSACAKLKFIFVDYANYMGLHEGVKIGGAQGG